MRMILGAIAMLAWHLQNTFDKCASLNLSVCHCNELFLRGFLRKISANAFFIVIYLFSASLCWVFVCTLCLSYWQRVPLFSLQIPLFHSVHTTTHTHTLDSPYQNIKLIKRSARALTIPAYEYNEQANGEEEEENGRNFLLVFYIRNYCYYLSYTHFPFSVARSLVILCHKMCISQKFTFYFMSRLEIDRFYEYKLEGMFAGRERYEYDVLVWRRKKCSLPTKTNLRIVRERPAERSWHIRCSSFLCRYSINAS